MTRMILIIAAIGLASCTTTTASVPNLPAAKASCKAETAPSNCDGNHLPPPPVSPDSDNQDSENQYSEN